MEWIIFIDGGQTMKSMDLTIGESVKEMIESDLKAVVEEDAHHVADLCTGRTRQRQRS